MLERTHTVGDAIAEPVGEERPTEVTLCGWVERQRDLGNLIFFRLRDRWGSLQVKVDLTENAAAHAIAKRLRAEYVVAVFGHLCMRPREEQKDEPGGDRELIPQEIQLIAEAKTPPFYITDETPGDENLRLSYRYLDLRRPPMVRVLELRHRVALEIRRFLDGQGFLEIETPLLTKPTPEGARDFIVPARMHPGKFYALPQSPQLLKQVLMVAGVDRYFQLARCLRDEDLRANRQLEHTQLDLEASFMSREQLFSLMEELMCILFERVGADRPESPFLRLTYQDATARFGTDKPDLRIPAQIRDHTELFAGGEFKRFADAAESGGEVHGFFASGLKVSRKQEQEISTFVRERGGAGVILSYLTGDGSASGVLKKFLDAPRLELVRNQHQLELNAKGTLVLMAGARDKILPLLGALRLHLWERYQLARSSGWRFLWVTDFPLYEPDEETGEPVPAHHPFTLPLPEDLHLLETDPLRVRADSYDLVLNGVELGSGSHRIQDAELQRRVLRNLGMTDETIEERFGFLLKAYDYGGPPHRGIALGLDRIVMVLAGLDNIRDVIAFPKTTQGTCPLTGAPSEVEPRQLDELKLKGRG